VGGSAKLERAADLAEPDWQAVALMPRWSLDIIRKRAGHFETVVAVKEKCVVYVVSE